MYTFKATAIENNTIQIETNTYWNCKAEGNFKLSSYDGSGNTIVSVLIPDDAPTVEGTIYFSYGNGVCSIFILDVYYTNNCYISTNPSYELCNNERVLTLRYKQPNEAFMIDVFSFGGWVIGDANNVSYFVNENSLMVISPSTGTGSLKIIPSLCSSNFIIVRFISN